MTIAETTSVLLTKNLRTEPCLRHWTPHRCGDPDGQLGRRLHRVLTASGKCISMVHFPLHGNRLVYVPLIKVAIMRHGSTWISSTGATLVHAHTALGGTCSENVSSGTVNWLRKWSNFTKLRVLVWMITNSSRTRVTRSNHGRGTRMGHARFSFTCLISSITSERTGNLYSVLSSYQQHLRHKERHRQEAHSHSSCIMISQEVALVAGDFNGTPWRCRSRNNLSTVDEAFTDCVLPTSTARPPLWGPGSWAGVCGFFKPPGSQRFGKVNKQGAFSIPRKTLDLRPNDQSCHHETWLHLDFVDWRNTCSRAHCPRRDMLKKCFERHCELAKKVKQLYKVTSSCLDDHQFKQDESYPIKSWKGNRNGSCKVFFHLPHFVDHEWADR